MKRWNVLLLGGQNYSHGRRILRGVLRFAASQQTPWRVSWGEMTLNRGQWDGVITPLLNPVMVRQARRYARAGAAVVNVSGALESPGFPTVVADNVAIGRMAGQHFLKRLYRSFAFAGMAGQHYSVQRLRGFIEVVGSCRQTTVSSGPALARFIRGLPTGTGILAVNDSMARRILDAADAAGRRVPQELGVIGVDVEEEIGMALDTQLTSVDPDSWQIGHEAAVLLQRLLEGAAAPVEKILVPPLGVLERESTGIPEGADPRLRAALGWIDEHAGQRLDIAALARACGAGRRTLEVLFRRELGCGINDLVRQRRIQRACELLRGTALPVAEVAARSGFSDVYYFSAAFKRTTGSAPTVFRRQFQAAPESEKPSPATGRR